MAEVRLPLRRGRRRVAVWLLVGLGLLIFFISPLVGLLAEWPWFSALGYERVFATRLVASFTLGVLAGGVAFAFLYANLRFAQRGIVPNPVVMPASAQTPAVDVTRLVRRLALPSALAFALFLALAVSTGWMPVLQFLHQTPFGVTDPVFGRDLAYYVFTLPIVTGVLAILTVLVTVSLLACGALYALRGDVVVYRRTVTIEPSARLHLGPRQRAGARPLGRGAARRARHPGESPHHRQRAVVGSRPPAADVRAAPGNPHLLRLRVGGRRPLRCRRPLPPGDAVTARAQFGVVADAHLHQRAAHLYARDGADAGARQ